MQRTSAWPLIAATAGLVVLAVILLTAPDPALVTRIPGSTGEIIRGRVVRVLEEGARTAGGREEPFARLEVQAENGSIAGATLQVEERAIGTTNRIRRFSPGDAVLLSYTRNADGTDAAYIAEYVRTPQLGWLAAIFAVTIGVVGGFQGLRSLLGMAISFIVILRFIIPHILVGDSPVVVSVIGAMLVLVATLYLAHGFNAKTSAALLGTIVALMLTGALGQAFIDWTHLTGLASEEATYLSGRTGVSLNFQGLLLSGLIIGTLGVLDDVAVSQSSAVYELRAANPAFTASELFRRGMRIGRDHIASTVNTLFLAYAGASLPLLLLLSTQPEPVGTLINRELITVEVVNALVGSIGLIAAVPFTTAAAAIAVTRGWSGATPSRHDGSGRGRGPRSNRPNPLSRSSGDQPSVETGAADRRRNPALARSRPRLQTAPRRDAMVIDATRCAHCDSRIVDPTSQVVHGNLTFCCPNCSNAMEQGGSGSDPQAGEDKGDLRCAHCGCAIVDETTMETEGDDAFCCVNCARAMATMGTG